MTILRTKAYGCLQFDPDDPNIQYLRRRLVQICAERQAHHLNLLDSELLCELYVALDFASDPSLAALPRSSSICKSPSRPLRPGRPSTQH